MTVIALALPPFFLPWAAHPVEWRQIQPKTLMTQSGRGQDLESQRFPSGQVEGFQEGSSRKSSLFWLHLGKDPN